MTRPTDEYQKLCTESEKLPDVFEFLSNSSGLNDKTKVDILLVDQFQRWKNNQVIPVDQYFDRTPELDDVLKVELLIEEYGYLDQRGIAPSPEEFAKRYGSLSFEARQELHDALELDFESDGSDSDSTGGRSNHSSSVSKSQLPELVGRYQIIRSLGRGAFGKVFLAKDPDLDRSVAIKLPTNERVKMGGGVEEFLNEAKAVAKLDHPNIVPVYDCGVTEDGRCFVVSKYIRGKELRTEMRKDISHRESAKIVGMLARALHVAHSAGIVHRDVKPGNIIIDSKRKPHLLDFGLARREQDSNDHDALVGTPAYMSPEQAERGGLRVDGRSDIYSLAVVFYELLTGHRPCKSDKAEDILAQLKLGEVRPPRQTDDTIPVELEQICLKALSRKLSDRYNTAKDMADEIEMYLVETSAVEDSQGSLADGSFGSSVSFRSSKKAVPASPVASFFSSPATFFFATLLTIVAAIIYFAVVLKNNSDANGYSASSPDSAVDSTEVDLADPNSPDSGSHSKRVGVIGFRNLSESQDTNWLGLAFAELMTAELAKSEGLEMVTSENIGLMKADLDLNDTSNLGSSTLNRIKDRLGVDWVMLGSYSTESNEAKTIRLDITLQNTTDLDSKIEFTRDTELENWADLPVSSSAELRKQMGLPAPDVSATGQLLPQTPRNLQAARKYFEGRSFLTRFNPQSAKQCFEEAAIAEPDFAFIQDALAETMQQLGDDNAARKHSARAVELAESLPETKRWQILGRNRMLKGKPAEAVPAYRSLLKANNGSIEARLMLASAMTSAGQGWPALELLEESRSQPLHGSAKARIDLASAKAAQSVSEFSQQLEFSHSAAGAAKQVGARRLEGLANLNEGQAQRRVGDHDAAVVCFEKAVGRLKQHGDFRNAGVALAAWGKALIDHGQLDEAESKINEGLALGKQLANQQLIARHTGQLGELLIYRGKFEDAERLLNESLESFTKLGDRQGIADMNLTFANLKARTGKFDEAMKMVAAARKAFQESGDRRGEARTWGQEGAMLGRTGNSVEAAEYFSRALELFREVNDRRGIATCLGDLATTHSNQGKLTKAGELYSEALELHRQMGSNRGPAMIMFNLSMLYIRTGRLKEARTLMTESHRRYEAQNKRMHSCFVQRKLGDLEIQLGDLKAGEETIQKALEKSREVGSLAVEAKALSSFCNLAIYRADFTEAQKQLSAARKLYEDLKQELDVALCDLTRSKLALKDARIDDARKYFDAAESKMNAGKPEYSPVMFFARSQIESQQKLNVEADKSFFKGEAASSEHKTEDVGVTLSIKHERARALKWLGRTDEALKELQGVAELAKKYSLFPIQLEASIESLELEHELGNPPEASSLSQLKTEAKEHGFIEFAQRLEALSN